MASTPANTSTGGPNEASLESVLEDVCADGLILCVRLSEGAAVVDACRAALRGGLRILEITLTTPRALDAIAALATEPDALVGAGTVLSVADVHAVADAGGRLVLSPVFDPEVVDAAHARGMLAIPGAATPTEIVAAHRHGARLVKVFPARALGGPDYLRAIRGPLPDIPLVPTNGPDRDNLAEYIAAGAAAVGVAADVFPPGFPSVDPAHVEASARELRALREALRGHGAVDAGAQVRVKTLQVGAVRARGVACSWDGGQYVTLLAPRGMVACGIFDPSVCARFGFAVAMAHGTLELPLVEPEDVLDAIIDTVSPQARALGIESGMKGREALARLA